VIIGQDWLVVADLRNPPINDVLGRRAVPEELGAAVLWQGRASQRGTALTPRFSVTVATGKGDGKWK
jgi:hypothetical protein